MNIDTVRAAVRGQLAAIASVDIIVAQAIEDAIVAGIDTANGASALAEPHLLTEAEVLASQPELEAANAAKRDADIAAHPELGVDEPLEVPAEVAAEPVTETAEVAPADPVLP